MAMLPYEVNRELWEHIIRKANDLKLNWDWYHDQGLLPETSSLARLVECVNGEKLRLFRQGESVQQFIGTLPDKFTAETRFLPSFERSSSSSWPTDLSWLDALRLFSLRGPLYYSMQDYTAILAVLSHHVTSRLGALSSCEATLGPTTAVHRFAGVQCVHDAAEALACDYDSSFAREGDQEDKDRYEGLVLFGYQGKSDVWRCGIIALPAYAESHLDFLCIMAHDIVHLRQERGPLKDLRQHLSQLIENFNIHALFGEMSVEFQDKFLPEPSLCRRIAGELVCDAVATAVAGPAYPRTLVRYFLPFLVDTINQSLDPAATDVRELSATVVISSLKARVSAEVALKLGYLTDTEKEDIFRHICAAERFSLDILEAALSGTLPQERLLKAALKSCELLAEDTSDPRVPFDILRERVEACGRDIASFVDNWLRATNIRLFQHREGPDREELICARNRAKDLFCAGNNAPLIDVLQFSNQERLIAPRHLIDLLVPPFDRDGGTTPTVNEEAVLLALACDDRILERYRKVQ